MTDITELAQREKFEAWWEREYKHLESSKYTDAVPHIKYGFWMAYQAGGAELVEALEKAQQHIARQEQIILNQDESLSIRRSELERAQACGDAMSARIRELEANPPKPHHNGLMQISNELASAKQRIAELESQLKSAENNEIDARCHIAELESRTVTVKLPQAVSAGGQGYQEQVERILTDAGIKWEAE